MSKAVLISIYPKWCSLIAQGKKTVEVRKNRPKIETPFKCYIYCSKSPKGWVRLDKNARLDTKVIGKFICNEIEELKRNTIFNAPALYSQSCMTRNEYFGYIGNKTAYIWHISDLVIYDKPKELSEFRTLCKYRNDDGSCRYNKIKCQNAVFDYNQDGSVNLAECSCCMKRPPQSWCYVEEREDNA